MNTCVAIVPSTGQICGCRVYSDGSLCGRHGGLSQNSVRRLNLGLPLRLCSAIVRTSGLRCRCEAEHGRDTCRRHRMASSDQDFEYLIEDFESFGIKKEKVIEMDYISKFYCCICMEDVDSNNSGVKMNCCKKGFCIGCINKWVADSISCPHCRSEIA